jgi:hypothetical protein
MPDLIKCQRCSFRGAQHDFPRKPNLQYLKTCGPCTKKRNEEAEKKRLDKEKENPEKPKRRILGKDKSIGGPPTLTWQDFISLLTRHKEVAFELHAVVILNDEASSAPGRSDDQSHNLAMYLAKVVWNTTGFRFKSVYYASDSVPNMTDLHLATR